MAQVALHLAHGGDNGHYRWWFDNITAQGVDCDVIALSFYGYWHGDLSDLQANLDDISARYDRPVLVVGTAYPFRLDSEDDHENIINTTEELVTGYPATPAGQAAWFRDVMNVVEAVPNGRGLASSTGPRLDSRPRERLGPGRPVLRQRLGEPGPLRPPGQTAAGSRATRPPLTPPIGAPLPAPTLPAVPLKPQGRRR